MPTNLDLSWEESIFSETSQIESLQNKQNQTISPYDIELLLEWAGAKLLTLSVANLKPKPYRNSWPAFKSEPNLDQDFSQKSFKPLPPNGNEIDILDKIYDLILIIKDTNTRRIIQARSLVNPITHRHIYPWLQIAELLTLNRKTIKRYYDFGLNQIVIHANSSQIIYLKSQIKS